MKSILLALSLVLTLNLFANEIIPEAWENGLHDKIKIGTNEKAFPYVRLKNEGAQPVILLHGWANKNHVWMDLGSKLYKKGYDVWAFSWLVLKKRNIDQAGTKTVPQIVNYVFSKTRRPAVLMGHSLGGIVSKVYLYGVRNSPLGYFINPFSQIDVKRKVKGFVSVASPNGLFAEEISKLEEILSKALLLGSPGLPIPVQRDLPFLIENNLLQADLYVMKAYSATLRTLDFLGADAAIRTIFNTESYDSSLNDVAKIIRYATGPTGIGMKRQLKENAERRVFGSLDGNIDYTDLFVNARNPVPFAYIAAELDSLAPVKSVIEEAKAHRSDLLVIDNAGHLDPLSGKTVDQTFDFVVKFIESL